MPASCPVQRNGRETGRQETFDDEAPLHGLIQQSATDGVSFNQTDQCYGDQRTDLRYSLTDASLNPSTTTATTQ